jgi:hypothetical protein
MVQVLVIVEKININEIDRDAMWCARKPHPSPWVGRHVHRVSPLVMIIRLTKTQNALAWVKDPSPSRAAFYKGGSSNANSLVRQNGRAHGGL